MYSILSHTVAMAYPVFALTPYFDFWLGVIANVGRTNLQIDSKSTASYPSTEEFKQ